MPAVLCVTDYMYALLLKGSQGRRADRWSQSPAREDDGLMKHPRGQPGSEEDGVMNDVLICAHLCVRHAWPALWLQSTAPQSMRAWLGLPFVPPPPACRPLPTRDDEVPSDTDRGLEGDGAVHTQAMVEAGGLVENNLYTGHVMQPVISAVQFCVLHSVH